MISALLVAALVAPPLALSDAEPSAGGFRRIVLDEAFYGEGAHFADFDRDGAADVVSGPRIYFGPDFERRIEIFPAQAFDPLHYSDSFFSWPGDLDRDGWIDVLQVGFPGVESFWYQNPGAAGGAWQRHLVTAVVDNESPAFVDLVGDELPELVCNVGGAFVYFTQAEDPRAPWIAHALTPDLGKQRFTHGLGVGDVNGDGRADVLEKDGWWEQPAELAGDPLWKQHPVSFSKQIGGAQMHVYDIDGDGDSDVVASLHAHAWGSAWFEQLEGGAFREHTLTGATREANPYGVRISAQHALDVADIDGDGLLDLVTGKRHWSHGPTGDPGASEPSELYWFRLERRADGVHFVPHLIDSHSGVGTQVVAGDVDGDGRVDVVVGNKQGTFVFLQEEKGAATDEPPLFDATPEPSPNQREGRRAKSPDGRELNLGFESGDLTDWTAQGEAFEGQPVLGDSVAQRGLDPVEHVGRAWLGGYELLGDGPTGTLTSVAFELDADWASFLIAGGDHFATRVELVTEAGEVLSQVSGANYESLRVVLVDLREQRGERAQLRIVDEESGGWGHINFDDFLLHDEQPVIASDRVALMRDHVEHAGLSAEDAARAMSVPPGFHVDVIASEPDLHQPIALAIDDAGRLWVAEAHTYPQRRPEGEGEDTILVFEDADGDGEFERRVVFAEGLNLVSGLQVGFGGVWVGAAPYLMFLPDRDGDLVLDGEPQILLDGWGYEDTHETLNSFSWGPDGWLYGCHGVFTHSAVGAPGTADEERVPLNAGVWRFHPTRHEFEVFAEGTSNPWGIDFDESGQAFVTACVIPHLYHMAQGGRYQRQAGSHFDPYTYEDIRTIADHRHYLGSNPHGGNNRSSAAGGGHAHCGALIYQGDSFPEQYRGSIFMNNVHGNRINSDALLREGSGFIGQHEDDLLLANDQWFRGIALETGPDGSLYFIDWSDEQACHHKDVERWDRTNGRLYRLRFGEASGVAIDLGTATDDELLALLDHDNSWHARHAQRLLQERVDASQRGLLHGRRLGSMLRPWLCGEGEPRSRLRALWAMHVTAGLDSELSRRSLSEQDEDLVAWTIQLVAEDRELTTEQWATFIELARTTNSERVLLYLASALERLGGRIYASFDLARELLARGEHEDDPNLSYVLWYGLSKLISADPARGLELAQGSALSRPRRLALQQLAATAEGREVLCQELLSADEAWTADVLDALDRALAERRGVEAPRAWPAAYERLSDGQDEARRERALWIAAAFGDACVVPQLVALVEDSATPLDKRTRALESLAATSVDDLAPVFLEALGVPELRAIAIAALAQHADSAAPSLLLLLYPDLSEEQRRAVCATLSARVEYAKAMLGALEKGELPRADVSAFIVRNLRSYEDADLQARVTALFGIERESDADKLAQIAALTAELSVPDVVRTRPANGRLVFERTCAQCHTLFGHGGDLAPELTGSNRADLDYLLTNMVDPNAVIGRDYQVTIVRTHDGLLLTGVLKQENEDGLVLQSETETSVVALDEIEERVLSDVSAMPEGQIETLAPGELRDLVAYLRSPNDVEAPVANVSLFDGESLAGWSGGAGAWRVEEGVLIGRAEGLASNAYLMSEHELGDFHFSCEVLLEGDVGNSGIQFRSRVLEGGAIAGYQADIGPGWWGRLYEVQGRGPLTQAEAEVRRGEWNRYAIEARGTHVRTWLNGALAAEYDDPEGARSGVFALQLHAGGPTTVRFRNMSLTPPE